VCVCRESMNKRTANWSKFNIL